MPAPITMTSYSDMGILLLSLTAIQTVQGNFSLRANSPLCQSCCLYGKSTVCRLNMRARRYSPTADNPCARLQKNNPVLSELQLIHIHPESATFFSTISASASINLAEVLSDSVRLSVIPRSFAIPLYSISISYRVSMWSETKLTGTTRRSFIPLPASSWSICSVVGSSHLTGPVLLWYER